MTLEDDTKLQFQVTVGSPKVQHSLPSLIRSAVIYERSICYCYLLLLFVIVPHLLYSFIIKLIGQPSPTCKDLDPQIRPSRTNTPLPWKT